MCTGESEKHHGPESLPLRELLQDRAGQCPQHIPAPLSHPLQVSQVHSGLAQVMALLLAAEPGKGWRNRTEILNQVKASSVCRQREQDPMDAALGGVERVRGSLENSEKCEDGEESSWCHIWKVRTKLVGITRFTRYCRCYKVLLVGITARVGIKRKGRKSGLVQGGKGGFYSHGIWDGKLGEKNFVRLKVRMVKEVWVGCMGVGKIRKAPEW